MSVADLTDLPRVAVRVAVFDDPTVEVVTLKVAVLLPAGTNTVVGALANEDEFVILMVAPSSAGSWSRVIVPVMGNEVPPVTLVGAIVKDLMTGGTVPELANALKSSTPHPVV